MECTHFNFYGDMARSVSGLTQVSGRYPIQERAERLILNDVFSKLRVSPGHSLLEIDCEPSNILIPMAFFAERCTGIDHPDIVERFRARFASDRIELIAGDFLQIETLPKYDRVLIYSVVHTLKNAAAVDRFVDKALSMLKPDGRLLIGDLANRDMRKRFHDSERGKRFQEKWNADQTGAPPEAVTPPTDKTVRTGDDLSLALVARIRRAGWNAFLCEQPQGLPFGNSREDIVVVGPEYAE